MSLHGWPLGNQHCFLGDEYEDDTWNFFGIADRYEERMRERTFW